MNRLGTERIVPFLYLPSRRARTPWFETTQPQTGKLTANMPNRKIVVLDRALRILEWLSTQGEPVGVSQISKELGIPKASVYRILQTLEDHQFIVQDPESELYGMGPAILRLSHDLELEPALLSLARSTLESLARQTGETANLGVIRGKKALVLSSFTRSDTRISIDLGPVADFHCSSLGKALLLDKSPDEIRGLLGDDTLPAYTPNTLTSVDSLRNELRSIGEGGLTMDNEETEEGLVCFGAPIRDWRGRVVAAISVSGPKARVDGPRSEHIKQLVLDAAMQMSDSLTGPEPKSEDQD